MRAKKFTFTKTRKVKTEYKGICLDLTETEAQSLNHFIWLNEANAQPVIKEIATVLSVELQ